MLKHKGIKNKIATNARCVSIKKQITTPCGHMHKCAKEEKATPQ
jgi:hypothetical protein